MSVRAYTESVKRAEGHPSNLAELNQKLALLRAQHPGAIIERYLDWVPQIDPSVYIATGAAIAGDVRLHQDASVWYGCVLRADLTYIEVGSRSNLQDGTVVHLNDNEPTVVAEEVVVGHRVVLHGCRIEAGCVIGMNATVLDGAVIGEGSVVGAGAVVTVDMKVPPRSLVLGLPGKVIKTLSGEDEKHHRGLALKYTRLAHNYLHG